MTAGVRAISGQAPSLIGQIAGEMRVGSMSADQNGRSANAGSGLLPEDRS
jgi:hypothetical protein